MFYSSEYHLQRVLCGMSGTLRTPAEMDTKKPAPTSPNPRPVGTQVRARRHAIGMSLARLAELCGCAKSYLSAVENGKRPAPADPLLRSLELSLMLPAGTLLEAAQWERSLAAGGETVRRRFEQLTNSERVSLEVAARLRALRGKPESGPSPLDRSYLSGELRALAARLGGEESVEPGTRPSPAVVPLPREIPLINSVAAGYPLQFTDLGYPARVADEYIRAPDLADADAFAARVVGDSMLPEYAEGDIVIFSPATPVRSGMDCFARLEPDHDTTFKRVYFEAAPAAGGVECIRLQPLNSVYPPRVVPREDVAGLYAAISVMRTIRPSVPGT